MEKLVEIIKKAKAGIETSTVSTISTAKIAIIVAAIFVTSAGIGGAVIGYNQFTLNQELEREYNAAQLVEEDSFALESLIKEGPEEDFDNLVEEDIIDNKNYINVDSVTIGDTILFGNIEGESIEWDVLDITENGILVVSHYILDTHAFDQEGVYYKELEKIEWESSDIREWLNSDFYEEAFSVYEKSLIKESVIKNSYANGYYKDWDKVDCNPVADTKDKIFLLSLEEILKYYGPAEECTFLDGEGGAIACSKAICEYPQHKSSSYWWWSRTPRAIDGVNIVIVESSGIVYCGLPTVKEVGVRPVLYISNKNSNAMIAISDRVQR